VSEVDTRDGGGFLSQYGAVTTDVSLALSVDMSFEEYNEIVRLLGRISRASAWWIGDTITQGEKAYGDRFTQAMDDFGLAYQTLANYASVCRNIEQDRRRHELSFGHHAAVAMLEPADQDSWMEKAIQGDWSRTQLREAIQAAAAPPAAQRGNKDDRDSEATPDDAPPVAPGHQPAQPVAEVLPLGTTGFPEELQHLRDLDHVAHTLYETLLPVEALDPAAHAGYYAVPRDVVSQLAAALGEEPLDEVVGADGPQPPSEPEPAPPAPEPPPVEPAAVEPVEQLALPGSEEPAAEDLAAANAPGPQQEAAQQVQPTGWVAPEDAEGVVTSGRPSSAPPPDEAPPPPPPPPNAVGPSGVPPVVPPVPQVQPDGRQPEPLQEQLPEELGEVFEV
jgi:hypothetical protein